MSDMLGDALNDHAGLELHQFHGSDGKIDCEKVKDALQALRPVPQSVIDECQGLVDLLPPTGDEEGGGEANHTRPPMWDAIAGSKDPIPDLGPDRLKKVIDVRVRKDGIASTERPIEMDRPGT